MEWTVLFSRLYVFLPLSFYSHTTGIETFILGGGALCDDSTVIKNEDDCKTAISDLILSGKFSKNRVRFKGEVSKPDQPFGCYTQGRSRSVYWNSNSQGIAHPGLYPICKG